MKQVIICVLILLYLPSKIQVGIAQEPVQSEPIVLTLYADLAVKRTDYPPSIMIDKLDEIKNILSKDNIKLNIIYEPRKRALREFQSTKNALLFDIIWSQEREENFHWVLPLNEEPLYLYGLNKWEKEKITKQHIIENQMTAACESGTIQCQLLIDLGFIKDQTLLVAQSVDWRPENLVFRERVDFILGFSSIIENPLNDMGTSPNSLVPYLKMPYTTEYLVASKNIDPKVLKRLQTILYPNKLITISADEWCPFNCNEGDKEQGLLVEIATEAFKTLDLQTQYKTMPWRRARRSLLSEEIDILLGAWNDDDEAYLNIDLGISNEIVFLAPKEAPISSIERHEIFKYKLGSIESYTYGVADENMDLVENHPNRITVNSIQGVSKLFELLTKGKAEIIVGDYNVFRYHLKKLGLEDDYKFIYTGARDGIGFEFSPTKYGADLNIKFKRGLANIKSSGKLAEIFKKYDIEIPKND